MGHKSGVLYGDMAFVFLLSRAAVPGGEKHALQTDISPVKLIL